jgi:NAD(P)-dependent dehydrogenase (short-subunit alcohol dehydrogenase family)
MGSCRRYKREERVSRGARGIAGYDRRPIRRHRRHLVDFWPSGDPLEPVNSATKHAVQSFVHGARRQVAKHNVRIGSLAPGMVLNELWGLTDPEEIERRVEAIAACATTTSSTRFTSC